MTTRIRKRGSRYEVFLDLGDQDAQRCPVCVDKRGRGRLLWIDDEWHEDCPKCHGELDAVKARRERWIGSYATKTEARAKAKDTVVAQDRGEVIQASKLTFAQFLRDWTGGLDDLVESGERKASTVCTYKGHIDNHIKPYLGHLRIQSVTPQWVDRFMRHLGKQDGRGGGKLSPLTRRHIHVTLHKALHDAKAQRLIGYNPADDAALPTSDRERIGAEQVWSVDELQTFLKSVRNDRMAAMWQVMGTTGLRRSEAVALRWSDVDLDGAKLRVEQAAVSVNYKVVVGKPKSRAGRRTVPLMPATVAALRTWKARQNRERLAWSKAWKGEGHVFTREDGAMLHPDRVTKLFDKAVTVAKVPRIRLHDLRHGFATFHIAAGTQAKHLQLLMGHSRIGVTMDTYVHPEDDDLAAAQDRLGLALG